MDDSLRGVSILIAGAGLAGLTAARELARHGADLLIVDARPHVGGRVRTCRKEFPHNQHAEAGGDLIDEGQTEISQVVGELGLDLVRILRSGFSMRRKASGRTDGRPFLDAQGNSPAGAQSGSRQQSEISAGWSAIERALEREIRAYRLVLRRWDSAVAAALGRESVAAWLDRIRATSEMRATAVAMRGFFLADPDELSLLALVDQFAEDDTPGQGRMYRVKGGNDTIATRLAAPLSDRIRLNTALLSLAHRPHGVDAALRAADGRLDRFQAEYVVCTLPATTLRAIEIDPPMPAAQRDALVRLKYGPATKTLLQFERAVWRRIGKQRAYGTDLPIGAVWDGSEEQDGPAGILTLLAGGGASGATQELLATRGVDGIVRELDWLGIQKTRLVAHSITTWEDEPWSGGGYAYFDPAYDPALRPWLARPHGRIVFAGEHTSMRWQGYMNGAIESGLRAAVEVAALAGKLGRA